MAASARSGTVNRLGGVASQGLNSIGNLALAISVAQVTLPRQYGAWAIAYAVYAGCQAVSRAVAGTPLLLRPGADDSRATLSMGTYLAAGIGLFGSAALAVLAAAAPSFRSAAVALALVLPVALVQDVMRYEFMARGRAQVAALGDAAWLGVQLLITLLLFQTGRAGVATLTLGWGGGVLLSGVLLVGLARTRPSYRLFRAEVRRRGADLVRLAAESSLINARTYLVPVGVGALAGLEEAGALRAGSTLLGVTAVVVLGLTPLATVEAARHRDRGGSDARFLARWSVLVFSVSAVLGASLLVLPDSWGTRLLAANWVQAEPVLLPLVVHSLLRGPLTGVPILLRAHGQFDQALRLRLLAEVPAVVVPLLGAAYWGAVGAAWGLVVNAMQMNVQSLHRLSVARRSRGDSSVGPPTGGGAGGARPSPGARPGPGCG